MKLTTNYPEATSLNEEELEGIKINSITTRGELDRWKQQNINEAMD